MKAYQVARSLQAVTNMALWSPLLWVALLIGMPWMLALKVGYQKQAPLSGGKLRIAILVGGLPPAASGGTEMATLQIAKHAARVGHEVHVIARDHLGQGEAVYKSQEQGFTIHRITAPSIPRGRDVVYFLKGLKVIRQIRPDVVHAQAMYMCPTALLSKRLFGIPYIFYERGGVYMEWRYNRFFYPLFMRNADRVIAQTEHQKRALLAFHDRAIEVIPNGVDVERFGQISKCSARAMLGLPQGTPIILSVGRARHEKNLEVVINAAALDPNTYYVLVGDGPELPKLKRIVHEGEMQNVHFAGAVDNKDVPTWMAAADVLVNTSKSEGFPNAILEGMAAGLPIVAPDITGMREVGFGGFLTANNTPESLVLAASMHFNGVGESNRRKAREYTWENVVRKLYG